MAQLSVQEIDHTGLNPSHAAADGGGDTFENPDVKGRTFLWVKNGDTSGKTVTFDSTESCNQGFDHDVQVTVPAGEDRLIGPFDRDRFGNPVSASYDDVTSVTVAAVRLTT